MTNRGGGPLAVFLAGCLALVMGGCCDAPRVFSPSVVFGGGAPIEADAPSYAELASAVNGRVGQLDRLWARTRVRFEYPDERGETRGESGEGHFQWRRPGLGLSVGKLGETLVWIGMDADRYWLIERYEADRGYVGRHELATIESVQSLGLPAPPRDMLVLMGLTGLPEPAGLGGRPAVYRSADATVLGVELPRDERSLWRLEYARETLVPVRVALVGAGGRERVVADLSEVKTVDRRSGDKPMMPSTMVLRDLETDVVLDLSLIDLDDGWGTFNLNKLKDEVYDFEYLIDALGAREVIDLDSTSGASP